MKKLVLILALAGSGCYIAGPDADAQGFNSSSPTVVRGVRPDGSTMPLQLSQDGSVLTEAGATTRAAFGETLVVEPYPVLQIAATYGLRDTDVETFSATGGSVGTTDYMFHCQSGTSLGGYGVIRSKRALHYRPGQGALARFTAMFDTPVALSTQRAGLFTSQDSLAFGYDGTSFGVLRAEGGKLEIQTLTITGAASGGENATITLDGTAQAACALTSGTVQHNAAEVAECTFTGWNAYANDDDVIFVATDASAKAGAFTFSSGTATGTFAEDVNGAAVTNTWTAQADWNVDAMDGTGPSGMTLDHDTLNVYQIAFQYLGAGAIQYSIEDPETGDFQLVHRINYPNSLTSPSLGNPTMPLGWTAASLGSTGTNLQVYGASAAGFVEGPFVPMRAGRSFVSTENVGTTLEPVLSIRNRAAFNDEINQEELYPAFITVGVDATGNKPAVIEVFFGADVTGSAQPDWTYIDETGSVAEYDETATAITGGDRIDGCAASAGGGCEIDLTRFRERLERGEWLTIAAKFSSGSGDITAAVTWYED